MQEKLFSLMLIVIEATLTCLLSITFGFSFEISIRIALTWFVTMILSGHYRIESTLIWDEMVKVLKAAVAFCVLSVNFAFPYWIAILKIICVAFFMCILTMLLSRTLRIKLRNQIGRKTLVIGMGDDARRITQIAGRNRFAITRIVGMVSENEEIIERDDLPLHKKTMKLYKYSQLDQAISELKLDQVIIAIPEASKEQIEEVSKKLFDKVKEIKIMPDINFTVSFNSKVDDFDGIILISTSRGHIGKAARAVKRFIDICAGIVGCLLLIPLTFYVKKKNHKNGDYEDIFFTQERIGYNGKPIKIYKYRSMIPNAEKVLEELMEKDPAIREEYLTNKKIVNDPRITEAGHFLRRTSLDEFPQFINVLKGEMSLVGPRPYLPREKEDMDFYYDSIIRCKPGITGMWQANGRSDVGFRDRCKLDDYYYRNWSIKLDLIIIYKTIKSVVYGKGAL